MCTRSTPPPTKISQRGKETSPTPVPVRASIFDSPFPRQNVRPSESAVNAPTSDSLSQMKIISTRPRKTSLRAFYGVIFFQKLVNFPLITLKLLLFVRFPDSDHVPGAVKLSPSR